MTERTAYIALGSNLGNREQTMKTALDRLAAQVRIVRVSTLLENPAVGGPADSPPFLNAAAEIRTELSAEALLKCLLNVEESLGRHRREKWGPRNIDLDLLLYDDQIIQQHGLIVPHPLMHRRSFVLQPLAEIAPDAVHPVLHKTISQIYQELK